MSALAIPQADGWWLIENAAFDVDGDGSPHCYSPNGDGLDYLANGGPIDNPYGYLLNPETRQPYVQGVDAPAFDDSCNGFYVSSTTYQRTQFALNDPRRYLNSETEDFIVVPGWWRKSVPGIVMGCVAEIIYRGVTYPCMSGDVGPRWGEGSISLAKKLGIPASPKDGGVDSGVTFRVRPGYAAPGYELQRASA